MPIYNALDLSTHVPVPRDPRFTCDLAFLANRLPDREARVEEFFLRAAALAPDRALLIGGNGWHDRPMPENVRAIGHVGAAEHNAFNATPLAVLNVARDSMAAVGFSPATRVFEAAGAAACLITDYWEGIPMFLEPEREILVARDGQDVAEHLAALTPERARAIGTAALERVRREHTYELRAQIVDRELARLAEARREVMAWKLVVLGLSLSSSWGNGHRRRGRGGGPPAAAHRRSHPPPPGLPHGARGAGLGADDVAGHRPAQDLRLVRRGARRGPCGPARGGAARAAHRGALHVRERTRRGGALGIRRPAGQAHRLRPRGDGAAASRWRRTG